MGGQGQTGFEHKNEIISWPDCRETIRN